MAAFTGGRASAIENSIRVISKGINGDRLPWAVYDQEKCESRADGSETSRFHGANLEADVFRKYGNAHTYSGLSADPEREGVFAAGKEGCAIGHF